MVEVNNKLLQDVLKALEMQILIYEKSLQDAKMNFVQKAGVKKMTKSLKKTHGQLKELI